jgi:hypothetical protein
VRHLPRNLLICSGQKKRPWHIVLGAATIEQPKSSPALFRAYLALTEELRSNPLPTAEPPYDAKFATTLSLEQQLTQGVGQNGLLLEWQHPDSEPQNGLILDELHVTRSQLSERNNERNTNSHGGG